MASKTLNATITIGGSITQGLKSALGSTRSMIGEIGKSIKELTKNQRAIGDSIDGLRKAGKSVGDLTRRYAEATREIDRMRTAQKRLAESEATRDRITNRAGKIATVGAGATVAGGMLLAGVVPGVKEAKHYETEKGRITALGLGDEVSKEAYDYAKDIKTYGTSMMENLELTRDALSIFTTMHDTKNVVPTLAKMKFGNTAMYGESGAANSAAFMDMLKVVELRGGAHSKEDFEKQAELIQKVVSATGGRVGANEWRNVISTGGIAAKLTRDDAFYYQLEPLVQMQGGDKVGTGLSASYSSLYQGRTTKRAAMNLDKYGLIGDKSKVKHDKVGQTSQLNPGALLGSDLFRQSQYEWVKQILIPTLAKKGITEDKEIADVIASIVSNRKGADLLATMVLQRGLIDKDEKKNRGAYGVKQIDAEARSLAAGKELEAEARLANLKLKVGQQVLPIYAAGLEMVASALERMNKFAEENPRLTKFVVVGAALLGGALITLGPVLVATASAMYIFAGAQAALTRIAVSGLLRTGLLAIGSALASVASIIPGLMVSVRALAFTIAIGAAPIGLMVAGAAALAAVGLLVYKYWEPIKSFFAGFGQGLMEGLAPVAQAFSDAFSPIWNVIAPVVRPSLEWIGDKVKSIAGWFGDLLAPINAASETTTAFGEAGKTVGSVVATAFTLMLKPIELVFNALKWIHENAMGAAAKARVALGLDPAKPGPDVPALRDEKLPPVPSMAGANGGASNTSTQMNTFNINQLPGEDSEALAKRIQKSMDQKNAVMRRSNMYDKAD